MLIRPAARPADGPQRLWPIPPRQRSRAGLPDQPITILVPQAPGASSDLWLARSQSGCRRRGARAS